MKPETFAQMMERYRLAQKKADAVGYGNEHDAFGCSDSYATIHAEGIYEVLLARYPNELAEWHRLEFIKTYPDHQS